jgi:hypothetical protein
MGAGAAVLSTGSMVPGESKRLSELCYHGRFEQVLR